MSPDPNVINFYHFHPSQYGPSEIDWSQYSDLAFEVREIELTSADEMNGVSFKGWIIFDADTLQRRRWMALHRSGGLANDNGWSDWAPIDNGMPDNNIGHLIELRNGTWTYRHTTKSWNFSLPGFREMFSTRYVSGLQHGGCN